MRAAKRNNVACENNGRLLQGYFDGELDLVRSLEFEEHVKTCPHCAEQLREQAMRESMRAANLYERAPDSLRTRIRAAIPVEVEASPPPAPVPVPRRPVLEWLAVAAAVLIAVFLGAKVLPNLGGQKQNLMAEEIITSHIRSMQPGHLLDVESSDRRR